ncbi:MAG: hypothetical protein IT377_18565 [Polyangiaceae bacterium]|nr:hypothetical protein [Polyangiaceae bacterium]
MSIAQRIEQVRGNLRQGRLGNEQAVSQGAVLPLLDALGWPVFDTSVVVPEFPVDTGRVDYALCHPPRRAIAFIEVKHLGKLDAAGEKQLFQYAFHSGTQLVVLTDGQEWHFFVTSGAGSYHERRVHKLDILERDTQECVDRLCRYLQHERVVDGSAIRDAAADYGTAARDRQIRGALPTALQKLLADSDNQVLELLADEVEDLSGIRPELDVCADYLRAASRALEGSAGASGSGSISPPAASAYERAPPAVRPVGSGPSDRIGLVFRGQRQHCSSARDVVATALQLLVKEDPAFLTRFIARPHGRKRRWVARTAQELYPGRPDLARDHSHEFVPGWYLATNYSADNLEVILRAACEVAGVEYGSELTATLRVGSAQGCD